MNYDTAKRLKDARFPKRSCSNCHERHGCEAQHPKRDDWYCYIPTLSELIEACGSIIKYEEREYGFVLWFDGKLWHAGLNRFLSDIYIDDYPTLNKDGSTPEEAVANLWLELNAK